jgi:hypothetical protein
VATGTLDEISNNIQEETMFRAKIDGDKQMIRNECEFAGMQIIEFT